MFRRLLSTFQPKDASLLSKGVPEVDWDMFLVVLDLILNCGPQLSHRTYTGFSTAQSPEVKGFRLNSMLTFPSQFAYNQGNTSRVNREG